MTADTEPADDRVASEKLRYVVESELPRPIALEFARMRGVHGAAAGPHAANLLGHVVRHAVVVLHAELLVRGVPRELRARIAELMKRPQTHGTLLGLARDLSGALGAGDASHPAARLAARMFDKPMAAQLDAAIALRNELVHAGRTDAGDDLKRRVITILRELLFLRELPVVEVRSCKERAGAHVMEIRYLVGTEDTIGRVESDLALVPGKIYLLDPIARTAIDLHPLYVAPLQWLARAGNPPEYETADGKTVKAPALVGDVADALEGRPRKPLVARSLIVRGGAQDVARRQLRPGDVVDGRYRVVRMIGEGGMAHVYEVEDRDGSALALKLLPYEYLRDRTMVTRFRREAEETRALDHPNVMPTLRFGEDFGDNFLIMPLAAGWDGALDASQLPRPLPIADAVMIAKQVAEALHYVHGKAVVHRDLKPRNLLLDAGRTVRLSDFGVAGTAEGMTLTMTGLGVGTPEYMAPEQIDGAEPAPAADLYGLGAVLYELLTGAPPYAGKTPLAIMQAVAKQPVPDPRKLRPEIPTALGKLVRKLLAKDPADRPRSALDVFRALSGDEQVQPAEELVEPAAPAWLEVVSGGDVGHRHALSVEHEIRIGRSPTCHVVIDDRACSQNHAMIRYAESRGVFVVIDLGSASGTLVNAERVQQRELADGDVVQIGSFRARFGVAGARPPAPAQILSGRYRLGKKLAESGLGEVYEADDLEEARPVAIRLLRAHLADHPSVRERFLADARATKAIGHPAIVAIHGVEQDPVAGWFVVQDRIEGADLTELAPLPVARARAIAARIARALAAVHARGMVHRNLTPANVRVAAEDTIQILELGGHRLLDGADDQDTGPAMLGTPVYAAPEQLRGGQITPAVDIYALGGILHLLLTGAPPFTAPDTAGLLAAHLTEPPTPPSKRRAEVPPELDALVLRALDKDRSARFPSMDAFAEALEPPRLIAGRYRLERRIREDAFGTWFDARDVSLERKLCVRVFRDELARRPEVIRRYAKVAMGAARADNPAIHPLFDVVALPDASYVVFERFERDLVALVERDGAMAPERAVRLAVQLARGLADVHRGGNLHGDVKPSNVVVRSGAMVTEGLIDFGAHELLFGTPAGRSPDVSAVVAPQTLAPELVFGEAWPSTATDLYGLGVILYFALTGRLPYTGATLAELRDEMASPPPAPGVSPALDAIVQRALDRNPAARFATALELAEALVRPDGAASNLPELGKHRLGGKYLLQKLVLETEVSVFYDAVEADAERVVTIRLRHPSLGADPDGVATARRFAWATASINHPSVLHVYDVETDPRWGLYTVMEPRIGDTLETLVRAGGPLPVPRAVAIVGQLARAVAAAHGHRIFPADLTPSRLFVSTSGGVERVRIAEFGLHEVELQDRPVAGLCRAHLTGPGVGKMGADVYALGVLLHYLVTGKMPFDGPTTAEILAAHERDPIPKVARPIDDLLARALAKDPARRYASARAMASALDDLDRSPLRSPWLVGGVAAAALAAGAGWLLLRDRDDRAPVAAQAPPPPPPDAAVVGDADVREEIVARSKYGFFSVDADARTTIYIDGELIGETPLSLLPLLPGPHEVKAVGPKGKTKSFQITVFGGEATAWPTIDW